MKRTDARIAAILESLRLGCSRRVAAASAGISDDTLRRWALRSPDLQAQIEQAEAEAAIVAVRSIRRAADLGEWRAACWWLERRRPGDWGVRRNSAPSIDPGPVRVEVCYEGEPEALCARCGAPTRARASETP